MWNPFKAIGGAIAKAAGGIGKALGGGLSKVGGGLSKAGDKLAGKAPAPKAPAPAPKAPPAPGVRTTIPVERPKAPPAGGKILPPSMVKGPPPSAGGGRNGGMAIDDAILGADSDQIRDLNEAIKDFEAEGNLLGLNSKAMDFLNHPSFTAIFDKYTTGSGFSTEQWIAGMSNPRNFRIDRAGDKIEIMFDADYEIGDYDLGGRSASATF